MGKISLSDKRKFKNYAEIINEEREKLKDLYDLINGVKPKKPVGAFNIFIKEKLKEKSIHSLKEYYELWNKLNEDEKKKYLKKSIY